MAKWGKKLIGLTKGVCYNWTCLIYIKGRSEFCGLQQLNRQERTKKIVVSLCISILTRKLRCRLSPKKRPQWHISRKSRNDRWADISTDTTAWSELPREESCRTQYKFRKEVRKRSTKEYSPLKSASKFYSFQWYEHQFLA